jgi:hypothetical protein
MATNPAEPDGGRWVPGATAMLHEVWCGRLWSARPTTVVRDDGELVVLWCPAGTSWKTATTPPTRPRAATRAERFVANLTLGDWVLGDFAWWGHTLCLLRPGDWHEVRVVWRDHPATGAPWAPWGWYVNLQEPFRRTAHGFRTMDLMLDVLVDGDRRWRWKDEDELAALEVHGLLAPATAQRVRDEALRVAARAERNGAPFGEPWHDWRPDPAWRLPALLAGWDRL